MFSCLPAKLWQFFYFAIPWSKPNTIILVSGLAFICLFAFSCAGRWEGQKVKVSPPLLHFIALLITLSHSLYHSRHHSLNYSLYHTLPSSLTGSDSSLLSVWKSSLPIPFVIYSCSEITNIALQLVLVNSSCDRSEPRSPQPTTPTPTPMHLC